MDELEKKNIQKKLLLNSNGRQKWHKKGVYFFFESNQKRNESGEGLKVTRVGTHALKNNSQTTLWSRLSQHKGTIKSGGGNHRCSIFRLLVGIAIIKKQNLNFPQWEIRNNASKDIKNSEILLEKLVTQTIGQMPFLYLAINDESTPQSLRGYIERNSIALLSNYHKNPLDVPSEDWLGYTCNRERVRESHLWNQNHVDELYDSDFLDIFEKLVTEMSVSAQQVLGDR